MSERSEAAERIKRYVGEHLREPITSRDVARAAGYSQFYAARLFREETGMSPFEYVRARRLEGAARELRGGARILDTALDYVFDSHEGFTRAFSRAFGISPKKFASSVPDGWLIPYRCPSLKKIEAEETKMETKTAVIFTQIVERPARKLILYRSRTGASNYDEYVEEVGCGENGSPDPWTVLSNIKEAMYEPVGVWLPKALRTEGTGEYAHALEVASDYSGAIPEGFDVIELQPCKYLIFQGEPYDDEEYCEHVGLCMERIEKYNPEVYGYRYETETQPKFQLAPMGWRGYIEGRAVKEIK